MGAERAWAADTTGSAQCLEHLVRRGLLLGIPLGNHLAGSRAPSLSPFPDTLAKSNLVWTSVPLVVLGATALSFRWARTAEVRLIDERSISGIARIDRG
jgi:hypothetical protein